MQTKNHPPTMKQRLWHDRLRQQGCCYHLSGCNERIEIHHIAGAAARFANQPIGHWFVIPLCSDAHRHVRHLMSLHEQKMNFTDCCLREMKYGELPFSAEMVVACMGWRR